MGVVALFVFSLLYITPGDPAAVIAGDIATAEDIARIRAKLGLDQPYIVRFGTLLCALAHRDLVVSFFTGLPVSRLIGQRIAPTVALTPCTLIFTVMVAVPVAWSPPGRRAPDRSQRDGFSVLVLDSGVRDRLPADHAVFEPWLPVGYRSISEGWWPFASHMILPRWRWAPSMALIARITRATMLDVLSRTTSAPRRRRPFFHRGAARPCAEDAAVPIVTVIGIGTRC